MSVARALTTLSIRRGERELVAPARPTPYEFKVLSDIDDQEVLRFYRSGAFFYRGDASKSGIDPAKVIKSAISEALVHYYPLAGRFRELQPTRKLVVECTGEGVVFVEADADVRMDDFGDSLAPPVPCYDELLPEQECATAVVVDRPLLFVQVTRLRCGGFVFGFQICHCIADGQGIVQFLTALTEFARGVPDAPTVRPVWQRELLTASWPPAITHDHAEYAPLPDPGKDVVSSSDAFSQHTFFFGPREIEALRSQAPPALRSAASRFDLIGAFMWRCRAAALRYEPDELVRLHMFVNGRVRNRSRHRLPRGYYGNSFAFAAACAPAGQLCRRPLGEALRLLLEAKARAEQEGYVQSVAGFNAARRRPAFPKARTYLISDMTQAGMLGVDFGWGRPVYGGPATIILATFHLEGRNEAGEVGVIVPTRLPVLALERLKVEVAKGLTVTAGPTATEPADNSKSALVPAHAIAKL
ncbi:benzyl alcohol O-benzoyltransferase-like [Hordeum vulgare]|nr:benzyl alcohol O-benzoyltransferase-like [Hordeum vulgare]